MRLAVSKLTFSKLETIKLFNTNSDTTFLSEFECKLYWLFGLEGHLFKRYAFQINNSISLLQHLKYLNILKMD
jgi:hypothetical protein